MSSSLMKAQYHGYPKPPEQFDIVTNTPEWQRLSRYEQACYLIRAILYNYRKVEDEKELRKIVSRNYPWGERKHWPYKAWCKAVRDCFDEFRGPKQEPLGGLFE